jgi:ABC-type molybdate transport system substrate-binding protein
LGNINGGSFVSLSLLISVVFSLILVLFVVVASSEVGLGDETSRADAKIVVASSMAKGILTIASENEEKKICYCLGLLAFS